MIDWQNIETVLLDLDGTLLDLNYDLNFWLERLPMAYATKHNIYYHEAKIITHQILEAQMGTLNWYSLDYWQEVFDIDLVGLKHETAHLIQLHHHAYDFLTQLKQSDKNIFLVTNAHRKTLDIKTQYQNIMHFFETIISSHDFGYAKEEAYFWQILAKKINFNKETTVFFDDSVSVLKSAKDYGIKHIIALNKPNTQAEVNVIDEFINITYFKQILPIK